MLVGILQRRERTVFCKALEADVGILKTRCWSDRQSSNSPIVTTCDKYVKLAAQGASLGTARKCAAPSIITVQTTMHCAV